MVPAPVTFKTYSRKNVLHRRNSSVDVFDALLAQNISKRKQAAQTTKTRRQKKPIKIKELPPPDENHHLIEDSISRSWGLDDTFDRLRKGPVYNIKPTLMTASNQSSSSSRILLSSTIHSPVCRNTRSNKKHLSSEELSHNSIKQNHKQERTLDKSVNVSLFVEKVPRFAKVEEISYLSSSSNVKSDGSMLPQMRNTTNCNSADISYEPLFTEAFRQNGGSKMHIASTPAVASSTPHKLTPMINETMSPILNRTQPKSLIESYEEIKNWNFKMPDFEHTPKIKKKRQLQPKKLQKKKDVIKNRSVNTKVIAAVIAQKQLPLKVYRPKSDWKLKEEPKVVLDKCLDVIGIEKSITFRTSSEPHLGFSPVKQDISKTTLEITNVFEESLYALCARHTSKSQNSDCISDTKSPIRFLSLRKRTVAVVHTKTKPKTGKTDIELSKPSTKNQELHVNSKLVCSKGQKLNNSNKDSDSLIQKECSINSEIEYDQIDEVKQHSSGETSATQWSTLSETEESREGSINKRSNEANTSNLCKLSFVNLQLSSKISTESLSPSLRNSKKRSRTVGADSKILETHLSGDGEDNIYSEISNRVENSNESETNKISVHDSNTPFTISLSSHVEFEAANSFEHENTEESQVATSDEIMTTPDVIPSTPPAVNLRNRIKCRKRLAETLRDTSKDRHLYSAPNMNEISTDSTKITDDYQSQTDNSLKEQSIAISSDANIQCMEVDISTNTNCLDSQMEVSVNITECETGISIADDDVSYKSFESELTINSESRLCDDGGSHKYKFEEVTEVPYSASDDSVLEYHNYSKICKFVGNGEIIEVSSSDGDEEDDDLYKITKNNDLFLKSSASLDSVKSSHSECENTDKSPKVPQNSDLSSKSNTTFNYMEPNCSDTDSALKSENCEIYLKIDEQPSTMNHLDCDYVSVDNSDSELDFSDFIASNEKTAVDKEVQQEEIINDALNPSKKREDSPVIITAEDSKETFKKPNLLVLKPGKLWRRSLLTIRRCSVILGSIVCVADKGCICTCGKCQPKDSPGYSRPSQRLSIKVIPESPHHTNRHDASILENYALLNINTTYGSDTTHDAVYLERSIGESLLVRNNSIHEAAPVINSCVTAREIVLRRCGQTEPLSFSECYPSSVLKNCFKIGEGVYGEVFLYRSASGDSRVMKVIPIEGDQMVNGEHQKKFEEILSEIVIAMELSNLRSDKKNKTQGFSKVEEIRCVRGRYPDRLLELWELFDETRGSENDSPEMFKDDQLYIVLELANGGQDMEAFVFNNALQAVTLFKQITCALAVAESALQFEHRDLHWGNILISQTDMDKKLTYCLNGREFEVPACGIEVSIIDFTLSRITYDGVCIFNDLSSDPDLFTATGDYQFEIYKLMQKRNNNEWQHFEPYSNVLWLHYVLDKMTTALRYKCPRTKLHKEGIAQLTQMKTRILNYSSVKDVVTSEFLS